jgi:predicted RND superfamily exporter protein
MTVFAERAESWLQSTQGIKTQAAGPVVIFSALSDRNAKGMVQGDFLSLALISICMIIVLRSVKLGFLSVVPNVVPIIVGYGVWYFAVGQMNVVASVAGSISLGIIVDDTIHFLTRFRATHARTGNVEHAMEDTLTHAGPAMLATSGILALGFFVLTFSAFQMTSYLGWLSVLVVAIAPLADLFMVPALVLALYQWRAPRAAPVSEPDLSSPPRIGVTS